MTGQRHRIEQCVRESGLGGETGQVYLPAAGHKPVSRATTTQEGYHQLSVVRGAPTIERIPFAGHLYAPLRSARGPALRRLRRARLLPGRVGIVSSSCRVQSPRAAPVSTDSR